MIILSLFAFASCKKNEAPPSEESAEAAGNEETQPSYREYNLKKIENDELVDFVFSTMYNVIFVDPPLPTSYLSAVAGFYRKKTELLEFNVSKSSDIICFYVPKTSLEKITDSDNLFFDEPNEFKSLLRYYYRAKNKNLINADAEDKVQLYSATDSNIPFVYNENILIFVCERYTLNFNDGTSASVVLKHNGKIYYPDDDIKGACFKSEQKLNSISSFTYKSQIGIIPKLRLTEFMWSDTFIDQALRIEQINDIPCVGYDPKRCDQDFLDAVASFDKFPSSSGDYVYVNYWDIKELLKIK